VWDLGQVLVDVDFDRFLQPIAAELRVSVEALRAVAVDGPDKGFLDRGRLAPTAFAERVQAAVGRPGRLEAAVFLRYWASIFEARPGAARWLPKLGRTHEQWLLSDTDPVHFLRCHHDVPWLQGLDRFVLSYQTGRLKVDPGAFDEFADEVARRDVLFWDDRADNVAAARSAGLKAHVFTTWAAWEAEFGGALSA